MEGPTPISRIHAMIHPFYKGGELSLLEDIPVRYDSCSCVVADAVFGTLRQRVSLTEAVGEHGHPTMRRLLDSVFYYPTCSSEVVSFGAGS